jgi:O-antigen/teichoic acid export membrane protein
MQEQQNLDKRIIKRIAKGTTIVLVGNFSAKVTGFIFSVLIIRHITQEEFGLFSLGLAIINIIVMLSTLGFAQGVPRYISYQLGKKEYSKAWGSIVSSFRICSFLSMSFAFLLFIQADTIAQFLNKPGLSNSIKILAFAIPIISISNLLISQLRATQNVVGRTFFGDLLRPIAAIILILLVIFYKLSYNWILYGYIISFLITFIPLFFYAKRTIATSIPIDKCSSVAKEIVLFSLPLLGVGMLSQIIARIDTLVLGYLESAQSIGLYSSALRLSLLIPTILNAANFLYLPVASKLYSQNKTEAYIKIYSLMTKWTFILTMPFFLHMFFAHHIVLHSCFGPAYTAASLPLQILSLGFFIHVLFGMNIMTCISIGKPRILLYSQIIALSANLVLDILLIPSFGITGAAIASCISLILNNVLITIFVYRYSKIHPFSKSYLRIILFAIGISVIIFLLPITNYLNHNVSLILFFLTISLIGVFITKNFTEEDATFIGYIEEKITKNKHFTDKFVRKFIMR